MLEIIRASQIGQPLLDVMVPAHNMLDLTKRCIQSICFNTQLPFHTIVVDDSTDKITPIYFRELIENGVDPLPAIKNLTFIHSTELYKEGNQFFNIALRHMKTDLLATVMNSMRVEPEWELVAVNSLFKNNPEIGLVGFKCLFEDTSRIESAGIKMMKYLPTDIGRDLPGHRLCGTYESDAVQWAFAMIRKKAAMGNLQEGVFHGFKGWDDIDNCFSVKSKGWKVVYCGLGVGYHSPRATRGSNTEDAAKKNLENGERFYKRWGLWEDFVRDHPEPNADTHLPPKGLEAVIKS